MYRFHLLIVTAVVEGATGASLLVAPRLFLRLLLGIEAPALETALISRLAGAALVVVAAACWIGRKRDDGDARFGLPAALFFYNVAAAALLAHAGSGSRFHGIALWPAVALHVALAAWCVVNLR